MPQVKYLQTIGLLLDTFMRALFAEIAKSNLKESKDIYQLAYLLGVCEKLESCFDLKDGKV